jgi:hypothetical protein
MVSAVFILAAFCLVGVAVGDGHGGQLSITYYSGPVSSGCATKLDGSTFPQCGTANPLVVPMKTCAKLCSSVPNIGDVYFKPDTCTSTTVNFGMFKNAACSDPLANAQTTLLLNQCVQAFFGPASMKLTCSAASATSVSIAIAAAALVALFF